jgi:hypothetical protein
LWHGQRHHKGKTKVKSDTIKVILCVYGGDGVYTGVFRARQLIKGQRVVH